MKTHLIVFAALAALTFCSCDREKAVPDGKPVEVNVTILGTAPTRATSVTYANESKVNNLQVYVFNDGKLEDYRNAGEAMTAQLTATSGKRTVWALVNAPAIDDVTTEGALKAKVSRLADNATDGFGWFSPYWGGPAEHLANGRYLKAVNDLTSVALVNIPNIQEFRLANESQGGNGTKQGTSTMDIESIKKALGLPPEATEEQVIAAIEAGAKAVEELATERTKAEAAEAEKAQAETEKEEAKAELANERAAHRSLLLDQAIAEGRISVAGRAAWEKRLTDDFAAGRAALANEKPLPTRDASKGLANECGDQTDSEKRKAMVNEIMAKENVDYDTAWARAVRRSPELFK